MTKPEQLDLLLRDAAADVAAHLPANWTTARVDELAAPEPRAITDGPFGSNLKTSHYTDDGPRVIRLQNIGDGEFIDARAHISEDHFEKLRQHEAAAGDVLVAMLGDNLPRACLVPPTLGRAIVKADCARVRVAASHVSPKFATFALNAPQTRQRTAALVHGVGRPRLGLGLLREVPVPLAPQREQEEIADQLDSYFSRLDDVVATLERVQRNLKRYRASVLKAAVEGRLVPTEAELAREEGRDYEPADALLERILEERRSRWIEDAAEQARSKAEQKAKAAGKRWTKADDQAALENGRKAAAKKYEEPEQPNTSELPELPEGWCWATVEMMASDEAWSLTDGPFGSNLKSAHYTDSGPRVIRLQNIGDGEFNDERAHISKEHYESLRKHAVQEGDLVVASLGTDLPRACRVPDWLGPAIVKADCIRLAPDRNLCASDYLMHALNAFPTRKRTEDLIHGVGRPRIGLTLLRRVVIPVPPVAEQHRIASEAERALSIVAHLGADATKQTSRLVRLRQSILGWAFEGRLVDQDPDDEPASVLLERIKAEREKAAATNAKKKRGRGSRKKTTA